MVRAGGDELNELDVGHFRSLLGKPSKGDEHIDTFEEIWKVG